MNQQRPEPHPGAEVHSITAAHVPRSVDQSVRIRRYLISMSIRTMCVICAVLIQGPLRWVFIAGAVLLPYVAVVMANAVGSGQRRPAGGPSPMRRIALPRDAEVRTDVPTDVRTGARADVRAAEGGRAEPGPGRRSAGWVEVDKSSTEV